jgi:glycosyltransferase involved in cell wall biosynthesis
MRIAYFAHERGGSWSGVSHKIAAQVEQWRLRGHEARVFLATGADVEEWRERLGDSVVLSYDGSVSRLLAMTRLVRDVRRYAPDVLYWRFSTVHPPMLALPKRARTVVEVNTDDTHEYASRGPLRANYNLRTRDFAFRRADALVFVANELSRQPAFAAYTRRRVVITNGIKLEDYPVLPLPDDPTPRLVFVGSPGQSWHGIDKLLYLAEQRPEWRFDIVGWSDTSGGSHDNVTWHGQLGRSAVLEVLRQGHVGIGTLALHRKALSEASALKVREYLAVGMPVIYGCSDPDADDLGPYVLRIPNTEANVAENLQVIDGFVRSATSLRVPRDAVAHIDVGAKEGQRLELFRSLIEA